MPQPPRGHALYEDVRRSDFNCEQDLHNMLITVNKINSRARLARAFTRADVADDA